VLLLPLQILVFLYLTVQSWKKLLIVSTRNDPYFRHWNTSKTLFKKFIRIAGLDFKTSTIVKSNFRRRLKKRIKKESNKKVRLKCVDKKRPKRKEKMSIQTSDNSNIKKDKNWKIFSFLMNWLLKTYYFIVSMLWLKNFCATSNVSVRNSSAISLICLALDPLLKVLNYSVKNVIRIYHLELKEEFCKERDS
jgi:hypothetical protein